MPGFRTGRNLGQVNFRKGFWHRYWGHGKIWPIADELVPRNYPRNICGRHFGTSPLIVSEVTHSFSSPQRGRKTTCTQLLERRLSQTLR